MKENRLWHCYKGIWGFVFPTAHHVRAQVDAEDGDCSQRKWNTSDDEEEEGRDLGDITGECVRDGLLQVVKDETTYREVKKRDEEEKKVKWCDLIQAET